MLKGSPSDIQHVRRTPGCYAIQPAPKLVRDRLVVDDLKQELSRTFDASKVCLPEKWFTHAVQDVLFTLMLGPAEYASTSDLIEEEVNTQTGQKPVSCRPSRHGPNPDTGAGTCLVSLLSPATHRFTLFDCSGPAYLVQKAPKIAVHSTGCQGYCFSGYCSRAPRCGHCGDTLQGHPSGQCDKPAKCANYHGPYEAGHERCPAAPRRANGEIKRPSYKKSKKIRRNRRLAYANANAVAAPRASAAPTITNEEFTVVSLSRQARKRDREGSAPLYSRGRKNPCI